RAAAAAGRRRRGRGRARARGRAVEEALSRRVRIDWLSAHPRHAAALAEAHVQVFGALLPGWTAEQALAELRAHDRPATVPSTLVALDGDGDWLGSVSLLAEDHPDIPQYSPWLASLYVRPEARARGVGRALVARAGAEAGQGGTRTLYPHRQPDGGGRSRTLGWRDRGRALVARAVAEAGQVGTRTLYLYCKPDVAGWYRTLGWRDHDLLRLGPLEVHVLAIDCGNHR